MSKGLKTALKIICAVLLTALLFCGIMNTVRPGTITLAKIKRLLGLGPATSSEVRIVFISVGQGDCALVISDGFSALIDAGEPDSFDRIEEVLQREKVGTLDAVFVSHPHIDHIGSLSEILNKHGANTVYFADFPDELIPTSYTYRKLLDTMEKTGARLTVLETGDTVSFPAGKDEALFTVLHSGEGEDLNDASMVLRLTYGDSSALFTADTGFDAEDDMLVSWTDISADVLKVAHHGSRFSTSGDFLSAVRPAYAVISCGQDNEYGYPKGTLLYRLEAAGAVIFRTDTMGSIQAVLDGTGCAMSIYGEEG